MSASNKMLMAASGAAGGGSPAAEGVSFDGISDYLSRSSDLTGNTDSKTFTFSCWVYKSDDLNYTLISNSYRFYIQNIGGSSDIRCIGANTSGSQVLSFSTNGDRFKVNTFTHMLISVDLTSSFNRYVYINDVDVTGSVTWTTYSNENIDFTYNNNFFVATLAGAQQYLNGRLSHLYLDYTYRDLSIEANRRLFIDAEGKPSDQATLAALNPILYLPMINSDTAGVNLGTGGDFTENGVLDDAQRGPNQNNCVASGFDGVGDYLSSTGISAADGKQLIFSCNINPSSSSGTFFSIADNGNIRVYITMFNSFFRLRAANASGTLILDVTVDDKLTISSSSSIQISADLENASNRGVSVNGADKTATWSTYTDETIDLTPLVESVTIAGNYNGSGLSGMTLGEIYFDDDYIDLAADNPFWSSDNNKPKPVRQVLEETGNTPLIAMPISADNPGKNYGTGGDFTVNGGGLVGARGMSEYIARSMRTTDTGNLRNVAVGAVAGKTLTFISAYKVQDNGTTLTIDNGAGVRGLRFNNSNISTSSYLYSSSETVVLQNTSSQSGAGGYFLTACCVDMDSQAATKFYTNNGSGWVDDTDLVVFVTGEVVPFNYSDYYIAARQGEVPDSNGDIAFVYFTTDYIDFSIEENRNLFVDQLGYPKDLTPAIEAGDIPTPLIYMPFDDPDDLGKNLGTGGDFTVNGTVTSGADFNI